MFMHGLKPGPALWCAGLLLAVTVAAQSNRPGWGATPYHEVSGTGVTFRVWAPKATSATVRGGFNNWSATANPLAKELSNGIWTGIWSADVAGVTNGSQYKYYFNGNLWKNDPRARLVTAAGSGGNSIVYDPTTFDWTGDSMTPPALNDLFIYELHPGTFPAGTLPSRFVAATNQLDYLKSLGVNAVELLPVAEFGNTGTSWGYDPAQPFAVDNSQYGGPDGLKTLVKACHARGLAVLLDVVHNHYGPSLLDLWNFDGFAGNNPVGGGGIYFYQANDALQITGYGNTRPNCSSSQVGSFIQDNFTLWLGEYHVDGFRWDTPNLLMHDNNNNYIPAAGDLINGINAMIHTNYPGKISIAEDVYNYIGFDSAWDTAFPGTVTPVLTAATDAGRDMTVIANAVQNSIRYGAAASPARVAYLESHDVVGDLNSGVRLATAIDPATPNSYLARKLSTLGAAVTFTAPGIPMLFQGQEMLENQAFNSGLPVDWTKTNTYSGIVRLYRDLIGARRNLDGSTPGLEGDQFGLLTVDNLHKLIAYHRWSSSASNQDATVIANFANTTNNNYSLPFPAAGTWYVHFNSDSTNYGPDYGNAGSSKVTASGNPATAQVTIGPYSALILSQTPPSPQLAIAQTNNVITVSWPINFSAWALDTTPTLAGSPPPWTPVPAAHYVTNLTTISGNATSSAGGSSFFRLRKL